MDKQGKIVKREHKEWDKEELNYLKSIGDNIIRIKKEKKLTSKYIYESLEIDKSNYRRIESGKTNVSLLLLRRISKVLNVSLEELIK
ncbi:MAG: helix-turn-helix transcriptional regulator [Bacteroidetes bacterium]|nr:helix-turn-helix transcriptional regulator [Bacteroidota bacterium]